MIPDHDFDDYRNRRVLIMGLGSFGGGIGAVKFLVSRGASVTVTDLRPAEKLEESLKELQGTPPDHLVLGGHHKDDFRNAELVVVNPAVKRDCPYLNAAIQAGVPVTSEMNLFWKWNRAPVIAITGSNGKSTTTAMTFAMIDQMLRNTSKRRAWLGGNIGTSLLTEVNQIQPDDLVVLELSSFQLADLDRMQVSPHVAVVTNFAPNHLDWHTDLDDYRHAKQTILRWQTTGDIAILNEDDPDVRNWVVHGTRLGFGLSDSGSQGAFQRNRETVLRLNNSESHWPLCDWLKLPGEHNLANALAASLAAISAGANEVNVRTAISNYEPLPHRLQFVGEVAGRRFYNDSLATTPESAIVALRAFQAPIVLLAGGYDKHVDLSEMATAIATRAKAVSLLGQTAPMLRELIQQCQPTTCEVSGPHSSFSQAFDWAVQHSAAGDVILLSPGCASYDWFRNFSDRGTQFTELVRRYNDAPCRNESQEPGSTMNRIVIISSLIVLLCGRFAGSFVCADEKGIGDFPQLVSARDWPWWRGPSRNGYANTKDVPTKFSDTENVVWKVPVPGRGHSSPTVVGNRVFLTTANEREKIHSVLAFDRSNGKPLWEKEVNRGAFPAKNHDKNTEATPTVASDGERLFATFYHHDKVVAVCLDLHGKVLWEKDVCRFRPRTYEYGYAPSPVLYQDTVIISAEYDGESSITALDRKSGDQVWRAPRPTMITFSTPVIAHVAGKDQMLISGAMKIFSYDPANGKILWSVDGTTAATCGTMVWDGDIVFASGGFPKKETIAVKADGSGKVLWQNNQKCYEQSMIAYQGHVYALDDNGIMFCWQGSDGKEMWKRRLVGPVSASPVLANGAIYWANELGTMYVFRPDPKKFDLIAENHVGTDSFPSPAICGGQIFLRVGTGSRADRQEWLYCFANGKGNQ